MHFKAVCEYGKVHGQCRCPSKDKPIKQVKCDIPSHAPKEVRGNPLTSTS